MAKEACWATVHKVTKSCTQLKGLSTHIQKKVHRFLDIYICVCVCVRFLLLPSLVCLLEKSARKRKIVVGRIRLKLNSCG